MSLSKISKIAGFAITVMGVVGSTIGIYQFLRDNQRQEILQNEIVRAVRKEVRLAVDEAIEAALKTKQDSLIVENKAINSIAMANDVLRRTQVLRSEIELTGSKTAISEAQSRTLQLTARKSDLELKGQEVNESRHQLSKMLATLFDLATTVNPGTKEALAINKRISDLQSIDKSLEMQLRRIDTQQQVVQTEISAVQRVIDKNIDMSFKTFD